MPRKSLGERLDSLQKKNAALAIILFLSVVIAAFQSVGTSIAKSRNFYRHTLQWREAEYRKLTKLKAGFTLAKFQAELGSPIFERPSQEVTIDPGPGGKPQRIIKAGTFIESTFQRRDYWVQTVSDRTKAVQLYAVTSCDLRFRPTFALPTGGKVQLYRSRLGNLPGEEAEYFESGATANSYFIESVYGGNPSNYQTFAWGLNDACPMNVKWSSTGPEDLIDYSGSIAQMPRKLRDFRDSAVINTYGETAPFADLEAISQAFQLGVDRILVRTVPPS